MQEKSAILFITLLVKEFLAEGKQSLLNPEFCMCSQLSQEILQAKKDKSFFLKAVLRAAHLRIALFEQQVNNTFKHLLKTLIILELSMP